MATMMVVSHLRALIGTIDVGLLLSSSSWSSEEGFCCCSLQFCSIRKKGFVVVVFNCCSSRLIHASCFGTIYV